MSAACEVLTWNDLAAALMEDFAPLTPEDRNLTRRTFPGPRSTDATLYGISDAADFRLGVVMQLHAALARYPTDPAVTGLADELIFAGQQAPLFDSLSTGHGLTGGPGSCAAPWRPVTRERWSGCCGSSWRTRRRHEGESRAPGSSEGTDALATPARCAPPTPGPIPRTRPLRHRDGARTGTDRWRWRFPVW
jgi:MmyB-like transcription regulator ligand binding domain